MPPPGLKPKIFCMFGKCARHYTIDPIHKYPQLVGSRRATPGPAKSENKRLKGFKGVLYDKQ